ncbi:MAG: hypothetical protein EZS28_036023 [Streblomastix strix]|uniref:Uncharacterized protein n=1 Tax=Streblomastix strix TaxID=222440 RepID=A0A5J4UE61_9EUKA|nr:MAG: hypothetical protein EZS28_036023 [Streblomastix strix]
MFIKNGAQASDILLANGDSKLTTDIASDRFVAKTGKTLQVVQGLLRYGGAPDDESESEESDDDYYQTKGETYRSYVNKSQTETIIISNIPVILTVYPFPVKHMN